MDKNEQLKAIQVWEKAYAKPLNTKKNIIEYTDLIRTMAKSEDLSSEQVKEIYQWIDTQIEALKGTIKINTMLYLKNYLKSQLGKFLKEKDPTAINHFIEFFKLAYPENYRRAGFTRVLVDIEAITEEQLWTTLTYINRECLNNQLMLSGEQKKDIIEVIKMAICDNDIKLINKIRSLKKIMDELGITIVNADGIYKVTKSR